MALPLIARWCLGVALICTASGTARAAEAPCRARVPDLNDPPALPAATSAGSAPTHAAAATLSGPIPYSADRVSGTATGQVVLSGHAHVRQAGRRLDADRIVINRRRNEVRATGHLRFSDPTLIVQGQSGQYSPLGSQFQDAQFQFLHRAGRGSARSMTMTPNRVVTLSHVTYTSCPAPRADWQIRARSIRLDVPASRGVARDARVDFEGIPILYLPWLSFPLSGARQSGFLFPRIGSSSRSGFILSVPWYWNIAPNQDATFTPTWYSRRGVDLGAQYRFLTAQTNGELDLNYLPHDAQLGTERSYVHLLDRYQLPDNWRIDTDAANVSDIAYFEDFSLAGESSSMAFLPRDLSVSHRDDIWSLRAKLVDYQTLLAGTCSTPLTASGACPGVVPLPPYQRPYAELPRLSARALWSWPGWPALQAGFSSALVDFTRSGHDLTPGPGQSSVPPAAAVTGARLNLEPHVGLDLTGPGYFLRPELAWDFTRYQLHNSPTGDTLQRALPILSLDSGLQFERFAGPHRVDQITLEPRAMYVYIPYRNQSQLPVFDTAVPDLNLIELFQPNRYVGVDRIGDTNAATAALTSELFNSATGTRYLSVSIGQRFYFSQPRVSLPGELLGGLVGAANTSNLIGEIDLTAYRHWDLLFDAASDPSVNRLDLAEVTTQFHTSAARVVNLSYRFRRGELEQLDTSAAWPIGRHWSAYGRAVYSLRDHRSIEDFGGFQFQAACWGVRAVVYRSLVTRTGGYDTGVSLQLELTGLASVGSGVESFLEQSILGYSGTSSAP